MARPENPISPGDGAVAAFARDLRRLRTSAGSPTYRELARSALFSASVLSSAANGQRLPSLHVTLAFVTACGGDREAWRRRWLQIADLSDVDSLPDRRTPGPGLLRPAQLPARQGSLVGSRRDLQGTVDTAAPTVLVSGPPGVGREAFALDLAHRLAREAVDGQLYADLGKLTGTALDAKCVLDHFLAALGVPIAQQPVDFESQAEFYRTILAERRLLVLLDNASDERQVRPLVSDSSRSTTLIVSMRRIGGFAGAVQVRLGRLSRAESDGIVAAAFGDAHPDNSRPRASARIAELCADLPLAIDITIRKLAGHSPRTLDAALNALNHPVRALNWLQHDDLSVRDALATAFRSVDSDAQALLLRAAQAPTSSAVSSLLTAEEESAEHLVEAGLVRRESSDMRLDRLVWAFAISAGRTRTTCGQAVPAQRRGVCRNDGWLLSSSPPRSRFSTDAGITMPPTRPLERDAGLPDPQPWVREPGMS